MIIVADLPKILIDHKLWLTGSGGQRANLWGAYLRDAILGEAILRDAILRDANLQSADLGETDLRSANLRGTDLRGADLRSANLSGADLRGADLRGANLGSAYLGNADLGGANLGSADLWGASLWGAKFSDCVLSCSSGVVWAQAGPVGTGRRIVTGVWQDDRVTLHAGCFRGSRSEWDQIIADSVSDPASSPWGWPDDDPDELDRLAVECTAAGDQIQASIHDQISRLGEVRS